MAYGYDGPTAAEAREMARDIARDELAQARETDTTPSDYPSIPDDVRGGGRDVVEAFEEAYAEVISNG